MAAGRPAFSPAENLFRAAAFLWGFTFVAFFRYLLDTFYPFYRNFFPISQYALLIMATGFIAAAFYKPQAPKRRLFSLAAVIIAVAAAIASFRMFGVEAAVLLFPLPLTGIALYVWYELCRQAFAYQAAKIYWLAGALISLYASRFLPVPYSPYALALVAIFWSRLQATQTWQPVHERLVYLRFPIDLLRYLFLAQAFHAALGQNRGNLLIVVVICSLGFIIPQLIQVFGAVRPHIQQGLLLLPLLFMALAGLFNFLHYSLWGASAYASLAIWESVYFAKTHEVFHKREKILAGFAIAAAIVGYYIATEWLQILAGMLIVAVLAGIIYFVVNSWRKVITALLAAAIVLWAFALQWKYTHSVTREFWRPGVIIKHNPVLPDAGLMLTMLNLQKTGKRQIYTNVLSKELLEDPAWSGENFYARTADPALFTLQLAYACILRQRDRMYIFDEQSLGVYAEPKAMVLIAQALASIGRCEVLTADGLNLRSIKRPGEPIRLEGSQLLNLGPDEAAKLLSLARAVKKKDQAREARALYEQVFRFYKEDPVFLRELAALAASQGQIDRQIELLNTLITLGKDNTLYDKKLLMELYWVRRDRKKSAEMAYDVLAAGAEAPLAIFTFLQKIFSEPFDRTEMQALYQKVSAFQAKTDLETIKYAGLKRSIEDQLKQNPTYDRKFLDENHRQEFISFPE